MSVREARLCDHEGCNSLATGDACELCKRDACPGHLGRRYLTVAVMEGTIGDSPAAECLGKCTAIQICSTCHDGLYPHSTGLNNTKTNAPFSSMMQPMRSQLIEAAAAFLAAEKLKAQAK